MQSMTTQRIKRGKLFQMNGEEDGYNLKSCLTVRYGVLKFCFRKKLIKIRKIRKILTELVLVY